MYIYIPSLGSCKTQITPLCLVTVSLSALDIRSSNDHAMHWTASLLGLGNMVTNPALYDETGPIFFLSLELKISMLMVETRLFIADIPFIDVFLAIEGVSKSSTYNVYTCIHVYVYIYIYIYIYTGMYVYVYLYKYGRIHIRLYKYIYTYSYIHIYIYIYAYIHIHIYTCIYMYIYIHVYIYLRGKRIECGVIL
jgi:hypothetical protein